MTEIKQFVAIGNEIWQGNSIYCVAGGSHCAEVIAGALNELTTKCSQLEENNKRLKKFIKTLSNDKGEIILMNGYGYKVNGYIE